MENSRHAAVSGRQYQLVLSSRSYHPTGNFLEFPLEETEQSIAQRFEAQVRLFGTRLAAKSVGYEYTFEALNAAANRVAHAILARRGSTPEPVALMVRHGAPMAAAVMGILKAGKFYLPLDSTYPTARVTQILVDSEAPLILTDEALREEAWLAAVAVGLDKAHVLVLEELLSSGPESNPGVAIAPDSPAHLIYTSGSTGVPKGVLESQFNVLFAAMRHINEVHICAEDRWMAALPLTFSGSATQLFGCMTSGAALFCYDVKQLGVGGLVRWLAEEKVTIYNSAPALFRQMIRTMKEGERLPAVRAVRLGGDSSYSSDAALFRKHFDPPCMLRVGYASTETRTVTYYLVDHEMAVAPGRLPLGYVMDNVDVMILDDQQRPVPAGTDGWIAVRSRYMAIGYWRKPELTAERFWDDPAGDGRRVYMPGDQGCLDEEGCLMFLGRSDPQVKVRGHRVELGEIEAALMGIAGVHEAVVIMQGDSHLVAYVAVSEEAGLTVSQLRRSLAMLLPEPIIPARFQLMAALPQNTHGKVDRLALPKLDSSRPLLEMAYMAPRTPVEEIIVAVWREVLGLDEVGIDDPFLELGGNSLLAMEVLARLGDRFGVEIPTSMAFSSPTVATLSLVVADLLVQRLSAEEREPFLVDEQTL